MGGASYEHGNPDAAHMLESPNMGRSKGCVKVIGPLDPHLLVSFYDSVIWMDHLFVRP